MNDHELDQLIARANPYGDAKVRHLPTDGAELDLLEDIISTEASETTPAPAIPRRRRNGRRRAVILLAAAATVAVVLTGVFFPKGSSPIAPVSAYGAEFRAVTDATPRLLIDDPAWKIDAVPVFRANEGEIRFARGKQTLQVNWIPAVSYGGGRPETTMQLFGQTGKIYRSGKTTDLMLMMPPKGAYYLTMRGDVGSDAGFRSLVGKLKTVDTDTWLDAMPDTIVKQSDAPRVIDEMLADVPVPNGFDRAPFLKILVLDRYHFAAKVTGAIACTWLDQWATAKQSGDTAKLTQAKSALTGSRNWKILRELDRQGGWAEAVWGADEAVTGKRDLQNARGGMACPG